MCLYQPIPTTLPKPATGKVVSNVDTSNLPAPQLVVSSTNSQLGQSPSLSASANKLSSKSTGTPMLPNPHSINLEAPALTSTPAQTVPQVNTAVSATSLNQVPSPSLGEI